MTQPAGSTGAPGAALPALIVLGLDDGGKAHASWFGEAEVGMAEKAAGMMGMAALPVADASDLKGLADQLPQGRVFESGRAFVPFVKRTLYDAIATHLPPGYQFPVRALDDRPPPKPKKASAPDAPESGPTRPEPHRPTDWEKIEVGSLVLATEGPMEGWFEARVTKISPEGVCTLRWRDWVDVPALTRKLIHLALLHPDHRD